MSGPEVLPAVTAGLLLLAAGGVALGVLSLLPRFARNARTVWPIYLTELGIAGTVFAAFALGDLVLLLFAVLVAFRVAWEAAAVAALRLPPGAERARWPPAAACATAAAGLAMAALPLPAGMAVVLLLAATCAALLLLYRDRKGTAATAILELMLFPVIPAIVFVLAAGEPRLAGMLVVLFILVETNDSYALLGGKLFGRHAAFPRLSPRKTVEGLVAGAAALALTAAAVGAWGFGLPPHICAAIALATCILATAGDLAASRLKRRAGVKDFPLLVPHQGGLLDIVDSWLLTSAVMTAVVVLGGPSATTGAG